MPCEMNTASFHPTAREFVCGGLDFRIYKYNFETGVELGNNQYKLLYLNILFYFYRILQRSFWSYTLYVVFS